VGEDRDGKKSHTHPRGVEVPVPQASVPKEREPIFKYMFIDVFKMIEGSHTLLLSFRGNLLWVPGSQESGNPKSCVGSRFLGTANPPRFLAPDVPKPG
jgi:hypothetical protein